MESPKPPAVAEGLCWYGYAKEDGVYRCIKPLGHPEGEHDFKRVIDDTGLWGKAVNPVDPTPE